MLSKEHRIRLKAYSLYKKAKIKESLRKEGTESAKQKQNADSWVRYLSAQSLSEGGQCKTWVWNEFKAYTGLSLPQNDRKNPYQWKADKPFLKKYYTLKNAKPGDIVQLQYNKNIPDGLHTFVIVNMKQDWMVVVDSNWRRDKVVSIHDINYSWWDRNVKRFTIYRPDWVDIIQRRGILST